MLDRMHFAKATNDELKSFYAARAAIEEDYSKKLLQLSRKPLGSSETGTLRMSCDVIRAEVESMGKAHQNVAQQMRTELEEPLAAFAGGMKERRKIVQNGIEKLLKLKMQQTMTRHATDTNRTVSRSRAFSRRRTWSWVTRSARTRPSWRKHRSTCLQRAQSTRLQSRCWKKQQAAGIGTGRLLAT
jgi:hypothetical protein